MLIHKYVKEKNILLRNLQGEYFLQNCNLIIAMKWNNKNLMIFRIQYTIWQLNEPFVTEPSFLGGIIAAQNAFW